MSETPSIKEALERIQDQIADLQGEHEVMAGPLDASKWKIEVSVSDLQALVAAFQPDGERREAIARIIRCTVNGCEDTWSGISGEYEAADTIFASGFVRDEALVALERELQECRDAVSIIEANRNPNSETQNGNYRFYQGRVLSFEVAIDIIKGK